MDSTEVASVLSNPIVETVIFLILLVVIWGAGIVAMDFIKGFNNKENQ